MQLWLERRAIVDGDALCVLSTAPDGGGQIALYSAPQITGTGDYQNGSASGVVKDARGRVKGYQVWDYSEKKPFFAAANRAVLYRHNPEPSSPRGASELTSAICTCQDLVELVSASKASAKLAAMFGLIETTDAAAKSSLSDLAALRNPARVSGAGAAQGSAQTPAPPALGVRVGETTAISLSPGKHLEILADNRPS